ncbi:MAG: hypothetical protein IPK29_06890 [Betaproteobacteria bacterium]|nr:hypothetical protein [Betaproteobacteria bacterium]
MSQALLPEPEQRGGAGVAVGRIVLGLALVALWELLHRWLGRDVVAGLADIAARILEIARDGRLARHLGVTLFESAAGLAIGGTAGLALPFALRLAPRLERALHPYIGAAMGVPKLALAPLIILWFASAWPRRSPSSSPRWCSS